MLDYARILAGSVAACLVTSAVQNNYTSFTALANNIVHNAQNNTIGHR